MSATVARADWKPQDSTGMHSQASLPFVGEVGAIQLVPASIVRRATFNGMLSEAARHSGKEDQEIADEIHISPGYMSKFMRGVAQQWAKRLVSFMRSTNSLAPLQWLAEQMGCDVTLRSAKDAEAAALRARLRELGVSA